jgi:hypothetical protein
MLKILIQANIYDYFPYIYLLWLKRLKSAVENCQEQISKLVLLSRVITITSGGFNEVLTFQLQKSNSIFFALLWVIVNVTLYTQ